MNEQEITGWIIGGLTGVVSFLFVIWKLVTSVIDRNLNPVKEKQKELERALLTKVSKETLEDKMSPLYNTLEALGHSADTAFASFKSSIADAQKSLTNQTTELFSQNRDQDKKQAELDKKISVLEEKVRNQSRSGLS